MPSITKSSNRAVALRAALLLASSTAVTAAPCDIYASGNTPCVAAHSSVRALYDNYSGPLYQLIRGSDQATTDISPSSAGSVANAAAQDSFCAGTTCLISIIYDQSGKGNHLTQAPPGGAATGPDANGYDYLSSAYGAPVTLNGKKAYGVFISPMSGYRNDQTTDIATGDEAQGMYAVFDGTHYNERCCFDYGNAETSNTDPGNGRMEAIYFGMGDGSGRGSGSGEGPWIMADLENGLFSGYNPDNNAGDLSMTSRFVTAIVKGEPGTWAIRGGDSTQGNLTTMYNGQRPANGYNPMQKEGAIILGIGGDNSDGSQGTFYEGVMTSGYPEDDIEDQVQANIIAAGYATTSLTSGPAVNVGDTVSIRVTTPNYDTRYLAHTDGNVNTQVVTSSSDSSLQQQASWIIRTGLANEDCISFESVDNPSNFIRHSNYQLVLDADDTTSLMHEDATFCPIAGISGQYNSFRSWSYPTHFIRHYNAIGYIASNGGPNEEDNANSFNDDVTFDVGPAFA